MSYAKKKHELASKALEKAKGGKKLKVEDRSRQYRSLTTYSDPGKKKKFSFTERHVGEDEHGNMRD